MNSKNQFFNKTILVSVLMLVVLSASSQQWWLQTSGTTRDLQNINFADDNNGLAYGDTLTTVLKTTNQGASWTQPIIVYPEDANIYSSAYIPPNTVIAVGKNIQTGNGIKMRSTNLGGTWLEDINFNEVLYSVTISPQSSLIGWMCGRNGYIRTTIDGGVAWNDQTSGVADHLNGIYFVDNTFGWAVGDNGTIVNTQNSGTNWFTQTSGVTEHLNAVYFADASTGIAVGDNGTAIGTIDGGTTWISMTTGTSENLHSISFIDLSTGWVAGRNGTILTTTNFGFSWSVQTTPTSEDLHSISMRSTGLGWACGDNGVILVYATNPPQGLDENQLEAGITVYPNPVSEQLKIACGNCDNDWAFSLFDLNGKLLIQKEGITDSEVSVSMKDLSAGTYMLEVHSGNGLVDTRKVVFE